MASACNHVFVVDDDASVRSALSRQLAAAGYDVSTFDSPEAFLDLTAEQTPGCLLLDLSMPGLDGLELQRRLTRSTVAPAIVFLTGHGDVDSSVQAMKAGAVDFLSKPVTQRELVAAIDRALRIDAARRSVEEMRRAVGSRIAALTPREREVFERVVVGKLNKQIAAELGTVEKTVKVHRARVMQKMGARTLPELVRLATQQGL